MTRLFKVGLLLLSMFMLSAGAKPVKIMRGFSIYDGDDPGTSTSPAIGGLLMFDDKGPLGNCTGTLVCQNVLITAAHCFDKPTLSKTYFVNDDDGMAVYQAYKKTPNSSFCDHATHDCSVSSAIWKHPQYNADERRYDIALMKLSTPIMISKYPKLATSDPSKCEEVVAIGYGNIEEPTEVPPFKKQLALFRYEGRNRGLIMNKLFGYSNTLTFKRSFLVAGVGQNPRILHGDSGSPVFAPDPKEGTDFRNLTIYGVGSVSRETGKESTSYYVPVPDSLKLLQAQMKAWCQP